MAEKILEKAKEMAESESKSPFPPVDPPISDIPSMIQRSPTVTEIRNRIEKDGYIKPSKILAQDVKMLRISILTWVSLILGDFIILLGAAISYETGLWDFTPTLWQTFAMSALKDTTVGLIGKIVKYLSKSD